MAIRSKMRTNSKSKRGTLKSKRRSIKRQRGGDSKHGTECFERKKIIFERNEPLICKKSLKHLTKKGRKRKSTLPKSKQEACYNITCWHKLSTKDRIMYKSKIKKAKAKAEVNKAAWANEAQIANKRRKELAEAEKKKTKEKAELNKAIKDTVSRYGAIQSSQKYFNNIREQAYAQLPPLPSQAKAKAGLKWANHEGKNLTETKMYNRNAPISMATQNNSTPTDLAEQAEGGLKLNNTRGNMFATTSFMGENMKPGVNVVSNDNTVLQNTSSNNPARNMSTPKSRKTRQNRQLKRKSHIRRSSARNKAQGKLKGNARAKEISKSRMKKNRRRSFRNSLNYNDSNTVLRNPQAAKNKKRRELEAELAEAIQFREAQEKRALETQKRAQKLQKRANNLERRAANLNLSQ